MPYKDRRLFPRPLLNLQKALRPRSRHPNYTPATAYLQLQASSAYHGRPQIKHNRMEGYDYNPSTGTYVRNPHFRPSHPPPLPPKEYDSVKETQTAPAELEASLSSAGSFISVDSQQPKRRKVRVLSLDGGGIRGYSTLVILGELMHQVYVQENGGRAPRSPQDLPRPCDYFDLIGGNGTSTHSKTFSQAPFAPAKRDRLT